MSTWGVRNEQGRLLISRLSGVFVLSLVLISTGCMRVKLANPTNALQPTISMVVPSVAVFGSKTQVAVIGSGFMEGASVTVGDHECTDVKYVSETTVICTVQPQDVGKAFAMLVNPNQRVARLDDAITFTDVIKPTAGFAVNSGSSVSRSARYTNHASIGEMGAPVISKSQSNTAVSGIQAITTK